MRMHNYSELFQYAPIAAESSVSITEPVTEAYQFKETRELVQLVNEAADLINTLGEAAFEDFRVPGSRWQKGETYIFVLDPEGEMLVHADAAMEGRNLMGLKDINGKPIVRGLIQAVTISPQKQNGWYHYQWPVPGGLLPRWKSSYVQLVKAPSGKNYVVGSGMYNDRMEKEFVVDLVVSAVTQLEKDSKEAIRLFHDPTGPFLVKDSYIFVIDVNGVEVVNPAFPSIEGRNLLDYKDPAGKYLDREIIEVAQTKGSGWVNYMWPKPGESVPTQKSAYVHKANLDGKPVAVGCGVYLADAPKEKSSATKMSARELINLVREAAAILEERGEKAYPDFRVKGSKWFRDDTYFFVSSMEGVRAFHAALPETEGRNLIGEKDVDGKLIVKAIVDAAKAASGEGWVHYRYPEPGNIFPTWKSTFVKRVTYPSGEDYVVGSGIYNMEMDKAFIEDVVKRASDLIEQNGKEAFAQLRDKAGPFIFMDTYVFVDSPDGTELVNPAFPSLEGKNLKDLKDVQGKATVSDEIAAAITEGSAWLECYWYKPGTNTPAVKQTYVRRVQFGNETYIVGSGLYSKEGLAGWKNKEKIQKVSWQTVKEEKLNDKLQRQVLFGEKATLSRFEAKTGVEIARHYHDNEEYMWVLSGAMKYRFDDQEVQLNAGEVLVVPPNIPHSIMVLEDTAFACFFAPQRADWLKGEDQYLRR